MLGRGLEAKHHKRQVRNPFGTCQPCSERKFQRAMKTLNHPITLWVETGSHDSQNPKDGANLRPNRGCELGTSIRGQESWDSETQNPHRDESSSTSLSSDGGERNSIWPPGGSVNHCQEVVKLLAGGHGSHQIQMDLRKSSARNREPWNGRFHLRLDLTLLTLETGPHPEAHILGKAGPNKSRV